MEEALKTLVTGCRDLLGMVIERVVVLWRGWVLCVRWVRGSGARGALHR